MEFVAGLLNSNADLPNCELFPTVLDGSDRGSGLPRLADSGQIADRRPTNTPWICPRLVVRTHTLDPRSLCRCNKGTSWNRQRELGAAKQAMICNGRHGAGSQSALRGQHMHCIREPACSYSRFCVAVEHDLTLLSPKRRCH